MASLPCAVGTRIFTIKETGEKLTYDQMRKHLFDNPSLMEEEVSPAVKAEEGSLRDVELTMRHPERNEIIFVPINDLLEKHAADQPSYDIQKEDNRIKGRVEKAKEFIKNYIKDQRAINPKTGERMNTKVSFEPSIVDIDANGKISFEDGRHRVLAAKELGLTEVPVEVPKGKGKAIQQSLEEQPVAEAPAEEVTPAPIEEAAPAEEKAPKKTKEEKDILEWVEKQRALMKGTATSGGALYNVLLDAIEAGVKAGRAIADVVAKFKDDYKQNYKNARKAIDFLQKGAPKTILEQLKQRNAPTKKEVQSAIDRAFAVGMGMGENKGEQAGIREGKKSVATLLATLLEPLKGKLNAGQITAIVRRVPKIYNPETYDKFLDYVEGVIDDANYDVRVAALAKLKTKALRDLKGKDISQATAANLLSPIRNLGLNKISPEDIGTYEEMLKDISNSRTGKQIGRVFSEEDIIEFIEEQEAKYQAKRDSRLQGKLDMEKELGLLPDNFTLQDYKDLLAGDIDEDAIDIKYKVPYEALLKRTLPYLVQDVKAAAADRNYQGAQKQVVDDLLDIDIDKLELPELILLNNVFSNIVESDDISNAGKIIAKVAANNRIAEFEKNNKRAGFEDSPLRIRAMSPENAAKSSYQNILANLTYNRDDSNALKTLLTSPLQRAFYKIQGKAVAEALDLSKYMLKHKIGEDANHKLGILTIAQQESAEGGTFKERVERIKEMAEKQLAEGEAQLKNADKDIRRRAKDNIDDAKLKLKIIDKYFKGKESAADVALSPAEKETMDRALKAFAKRKDDLAATTKAFYNKDMKDGGALYFPLLPYYKFGPSEEKVEGITENLFVPSVLDRTQAGSTKDRNPFLSTNVSYNTDFIGVFTQKLFEADYQIETTKERFVTQNILNDKRTKLALNPVGGKGAYDVLSEKIQEIVSDQKTFSALYKKDESIPAYLLNKLVPLFLNSVEQIPKQATGLWLVAFNTNEASFGKAVMVNGQSVRNKEVKDAINKLRAASSIVLRGHRGEIDIREKYQLRKGLFSDNPLFRKYSSLQQMGDDISTWIGSQTIQRGDDIVTNTALVAAYIDALIKNGKLKNAEDFDIVEAAKNIDEKSLSYAETFVDEVNAPSDPTTKAAALKSKKGDIKEAGVSAKNLFWTLKGFSLANNKNLKSAIGVMNDTRATDSEKFEALEKISGIVYATVSFALVGLGLKMGKEYVSNLIAQQILGMEPPEEDEKKRKEKFAARMAQIAFNIGGEFAFGGYSAPVEQAAKVIINVGYKTAAALSEGAIPEKLGLPEKFQPYPYTDGVAGGLGIPTELIVKTAEKFSEKDPETDKRRETTSDQFMFNVVIPAIAFQTGAGDAYKWNDMIARKVGPKAQEDIKNAYKAQIGEEMAEPGSKEAKEAKKEFDKAIKEGDFETARKKYDTQEDQFKTTREKLKFAGDAFRSFVDDKVAPSYGVNDKDIVDFFRKASGQPMKVYINISEKGKRTGRLKLLTDQEMKFILEDYDTQYAKMKKELQFMDNLKKENIYGVTMVYSKRGMPLWVKQYEKYKGIKP